MKNLQFKTGYLIDEVSKEVETGEYILLPNHHNGTWSVDRSALFINDKISKIVKDYRIYDKLKDAEKRLSTVNEDDIAYCQKQIEYYTNRIKKITK